jgi:hypothetical protein
MSYQRGEQPLPFLDAAQLRRMRAALARYLKTGQLRRAAAPIAARPPAELPAGARAARPTANE